MGIMNDQPGDENGTTLLIHFIYIINNRNAIMMPKRVYKAYEAYKAYRFIS